MERNKKQKLSDLPIAFVCDFNGELSKYLKQLDRIASIDSELKQLCEDLSRYPNWTFSSIKNEGK